MPASSRTVTVPAKIDATTRAAAQRSTIGDRGPPRLAWENLPAEARERLTRYLAAGARREHPGRVIRVEHDEGAS